MAKGRSASVNNITISISITPLLTNGVVDSVANADYWTGPPVETAGGEKTPDGQTVTWSKNTLIERDMVVSPTSKIYKYIETATMAQQNRKGVASEPFVVTAVVTDNNTGQTDLYIDGFIQSSEVGQGLGAERKQNRTVKFQFGDMIPSVI